jgi:glycosyltransferase involved in cell wall biosynthesis
VFRWRHLPHSYAFVCQNILLELLRSIQTIQSSVYSLTSAFRRTENRDNIVISFKDISRPDDWKLVKGLFPAHETELISEVNPYNPRDDVDIELRFAYPVDLSPPLSKSGIVYVLATAEYEVVPGMLAKGSSWTHFSPRIKLMVPSRWSMNLLKDIGRVPADRMLLLPHGYSPKYFRPDTNSYKQSQECVDLRGRLDVPEESFIFLHVGAGTTNKNMHQLLNAFSVLYNHTGGSPIYLVIKTLGALYPVGVEVVRDAILKAINATGMAEKAVVWIDDTYSMDFLGELYRCANVYVSPYQSEGFNMPVLESLASGTPVIVSKGGPTDDFTKSSFAKYVKTETVTRYQPPQGEPMDIVKGDKEALSALPQKAVPVRRGLLIDVQSLYDHMEFVVKDYFEDNSKWLRAASKKAVAAARKRYMWNNVTDTLIASMMDKGSEKFSQLGEL